MEGDAFFEIARNAARNAYAPYSHFTVGALLIAKNGQQFVGCNVENASFGLTICAERVAATTAIATGIREWKAIYIVSPTGVTPCGACRQFLSEFAMDLEVHIALLDPKSSGKSVQVQAYRLSDLLPNAITLADIAKGN